MLRYMTAGESHGKGIMTILDGVPAGLKISEKVINAELRKRMAGYGRGGRMSIEKDNIEIVGGLRKGRTIGAPLGMLIRNVDFKINELPDVSNPRPGHADLAGMQKFGFNDARNVLERASARETAMRVAAGSVAKLLLEEFGIRILSHVISMGKIKAHVEGYSFDEIAGLAGRSKVNCADKSAETRMCREIDLARKKGDTLGGIFEVMADGVPPGLGSYAQWDRRLDGTLARALMSIPAVKAVSIGNGAECSANPGSEVHDPILYGGKSKGFYRSTNNSGGLEGGITNGSMIVIRGYMKPIATLVKPMGSVDIRTKKRIKASVERSDVTAVPACGIIAEAVTALELASVISEKLGGDSLKEMKRNYKGYLKQLREM